MLLSSHKDDVFDLGTISQNIIDNGQIIYLSVCDFRMSIKIKIGPLLQESTSLPETIEVIGKTVGECLDDLMKNYPESKQWLYDEDSLIKVLVTINNVETVTFNEEGLNKVLKPGDELQIFAIVSGG